MNRTYQQYLRRSIRHDARLVKDQAKFLLLLVEAKANHYSPKGEIIE